MIAKVLKIEDGFNGRGGKVGKIALIECNWCEGKKWLAYSRIKDGAGKFCKKKCYSEYQKTLRMEKSIKWKGGRCKLNIKGLPYWYIKQIDGSYKRENILIIEKEIGRKLYYNECVHHINGNTLDNRIKNLRLMSKSDHHKLHYKGLKIDKNTGRFLGKIP